MSNYELMNYFINYLKEIVVSNPDLPLDSNFVYSNLMVFNVENKRKPLESTRHLFDTFKNDFSYDNNIKVYTSECMQHFLFFEHGKLKGNEVKLYIPLDIEHLKYGAEDIFKFISSTGIAHQSKIADVIRNDDLVIRVNNLEDADKIIRYVTSNNYIKEGMIKVNPFLPQVGGVGITMDNNYSYNFTVSSLVANFLNYLKQINRLDCANIIEFNNYIKSEKRKIVEDLDLKDIYSLLEDVTTSDFKIDNFVSHAQSKLCDKYTSNRQRITDPNIYFESAIKETSVVHPENTRVAILSYLHFDPKYFTNKERSRDSLMKYVDPGNVISIMRTKLKNNNVVVPNSDKELIDKYLDLVLDKQNNYQRSFEIIKKAYQSTLACYSQEQADKAIEELLINKNIMYFTNRYKDRDNLKEIVNQDIRKVLLSNIDITNLNVNDIGEIINRFKEVISNDKTYVRSSV